MVISLLYFLLALMSSPVVAWLIQFICDLYKAQRIKKKLHIQDIKGPSPSFLHGNIKAMQQIQLKLKKIVPNHDEIVALDYTSIVFPFLEQWQKKYGEIYTYSTGFKQHLIVNEPEMVKKLHRLNTLDIGKPLFVSQRFAPLFGNGIMRSNGHFWAHQRKIIAPEFFIDKVKSMVKLMAESTVPLLRRWEDQIESQGGVQAEITVDDDLRGLSADIIARACFGTSYLKGNEIFSKLRALHEIITKKQTLFDYTAFRIFPNKESKKIKTLEKEIASLIWQTVEEQNVIKESWSSEKELMQVLLEEAAKDNNKKVGKLSPKQFIVDSCKSLYFAGHDTTATSATWCLMLLAMHPDWQSRIRAEVQQSFNNGLVDADSLCSLKTVTMVIQETLRLYPPAGFVVREAFEDIQVGNIKIPKGVCMWTQIPAMHRNTKIWGSDANKFNPERFADGVAKACKVPQAYIPFGLGTRLCLGRNFAMIELKVVISLIISKFKFSLSPNYNHSPVFRALIQPQFGVQLVIEKV